MLSITHLLELKAITVIKIKSKYYYFLGKEIFTVTDLKKSIIKKIGKKLIKLE